MHRIRATLVVLVTSLLAPGSVRAHPLSPALLDVRELADGRLDVEFRTSRLKAPGTMLRVVLPAGCTALSPAELSEDEATTSERSAVRCAPVGLVGRQIGVDGLADVGTSALVRVRLADGRVVKTLLGASEPLVEIPPPRPMLEIARSYVMLGLDPFATRADHLLLVFALVLLVATPGQAARTVAAFAVGHGITLTLATLGCVRFHPRAMDLLATLSVYVLALELARRDEGSRSPFRRAPWVVALGFGLLHGFGFAGALSEIGLPPDEAPLALLSFNAGIALAELALVVGVLFAGSLLRRLRPALPTWTRWIPAYAMGSLSALWCFERTSVMLHWPLP
jgi:hypothetical protein